MSGWSISEKEKLKQDDQKSHFQQGKETVLFVSLLAYNYQLPDAHPSI